ncbi:DNA sulfur modification protein DndB [Ferrovibrio xuzhouensis]|uniref:DNA sulfur modification protein DndB n=1 Tax=Ferrovibrio xuzhouensis TaxID=1576914 RepID=A0ABV7VLY5_9PROT
MNNPSHPQTLADLAGALDSQTRTYVALVGENLGSLTLKLSLSLRQFIDISWVANRTNNAANAQFADEAVAQRSLIPGHAKALAQYTLMGLVNAQLREMKSGGAQISPALEKLASYLPSGPYAALQPIVCNIRQCRFGGGDIAIDPIKDRNDTQTGVYRVSLGQKHLLYVVDGQHRREGFDYVLEFLKDVTRTYKYPKKGIFAPPHYSDELISESEHDFWQKILEAALIKSTVAVEVHLGLSAEQEQQMFVDLNARAKPLQVSFVNSFDHSDPLNKYINEVLVREEIIQHPSDADQSDWHHDTGQLKRKDLLQICSLLFNGKTSSSLVTPALVSERAEFGRKFWKSIAAVPGFGTKGARSVTVLQQTVVQKAIAKLAYDLGYGTKTVQNHQHLADLFTAIAAGRLDFNHTNEIWQALFMTKSARAEKFPGIENYVFVPEGTNLDAGNWDEANKWVRFGSRHNDVYPRIGDLIRYQLGFSPRPTVANAIADADEFEHKQNSFN